MNEWPLQFYLLPSGCWYCSSGSQACIPSGNQRASADPIRLVFTWVLLTMPDFKKRERVNEYSSFQLSHAGLLYSWMALTHLIMKHKMWFGALLSCDQMQGSIQIANVASDKPGISRFFFKNCSFFCCFFFLVKAECRGERVVLVKFTLWTTREESSEPVITQP